MQDPFLAPLPPPPPVVAFYTVLNTKPSSGCNASSGAHSLVNSHSKLLQNHIWAPLPPPVVSGRFLFNYVNVRAWIVRAHLG